MRRRVTQLQQGHQIFVADAIQCSSERFVDSHAIDTINIAPLGRFAKSAKYVLEIFDKVCDTTG